MLFLFSFSRCYFLSWTETAFECNIAVFLEDEGSSLLAHKLGQVSEPVLVLLLLLVLDVGRDKVAELFLVANPLEQVVIEGILEALGSQKQREKNCGELGQKKKKAREKKKKRSKRRRKSTRVREENKGGMPTSSRSSMLGPG